VIFGLKYTIWQPFQAKAAFLRLEIWPDDLQTWHVQNFYFFDAKVQTKQEKTVTFEKNNFHFFLS
jgi:hypothetical protein